VTQVWGSTSSWKILIKPHTAFSAVGHSNGIIGMPGYYRDSARYCWLYSMGSTCCRIKRMSIQLPTKGAFVHQQNQYAPLTYNAYWAFDLRRIQETAKNGAMQHGWPDVSLFPLVIFCGVAAGCHIQALLLRCWKQKQAYKACTVRAPQDQTQGCVHVMLSANSAYKRRGLVVLKWRVLRTELLHSMNWHTCIGEKILLMR